MAQLRWFTFGRVLRMPEETPSQNLLEFTVIRSNNYWTRRGCHSTNLLGKFWVDLKNVGQGALISSKRLRELMTLAKERTM